MFVFLTILLAARHVPSVEAPRTFICWRILAVVSHLGGSGALEVRSHLDIAGARDFMLHIGPDCECWVVYGLLEAALIRRDATRRTYAAPHWS